LKHLALSVHTYGTYRQLLLRTVKTSISSFITGLDAKIVSLRTDSAGRLSVSLEGEDEEFAANALAKQWGIAPKLQDLSPGVVSRGWLVDIGKVGFGLYVDIGICVPQAIDALVPLYHVREQFEMHDKSVRAIASKLVLVNDLPVEIRVTKVDAGKPTIEAQFTEFFLKRITSWTSDDHERLIVLGVTKEMLEHALSKTRHLEDIFAVEQLGPFEYSLMCKRSTHASGIVAAIGPRLRGVPIHLFVPNNIRGEDHAST